ncbi:MAG: TIGR01620 family protein [Rhodobacteraceae bacterium]|nr:TIGR01620 family protein [Paracoccaceae bacterium]MBR9822396.1 TIGR01620 family protein [Paracoccaceae bacterium]
MTDSPRKSPVLIELDGPAADPGAAPPVPDDPLPGAEAGLARGARLMARRPSRLARWFWGLAGTLLTVAVTTAAWNAVTGLIATTPWLGWAVSALLAAFVLVLLAIVMKEITAFARLSRIEQLHHALAGARVAEDLSAARAATKQLTTLYRHRADMRWPLERFAERTPDQFDAGALIDLAEQELLTPLDRAARSEVEAAARQVATVTALVPLAFADVLTALTSNIRMIRRIAEIYGGRSGTLGSLRLLRAVMTHLVATGAVAMGDDMLGSILGGNLLARLSRRFGEGVVNGALTARVGVAAMEVCRPMPFSDRRRPRVTAIIQSALTGLFARAEKSGD